MLKIGIIELRTSLSRSARFKTAPADVKHALIETNGWTDQKIGVASNSGTAIACSLTRNKWGTDSPAIAWAGAHQEVLLARGASHEAGKETHSGARAGSWPPLPAAKSKGTGNMKHRILALVIVAGAWTSMAHAAPLNLVPIDPDISSTASITYDADADTLTADGIAYLYTHGDGSEEDIYGGDFHLEASIDVNGLMSHGTVTITGGLPSPTTTVLLEGEFDVFGFSPYGSSGAPTFEFLGAVTGGTLAADYGDIGHMLGTILSGFDDSFQGNFASNYTSDTGTADTFWAIPEPASLTLLLAGGLALLRRRRRHAA
jgi:hypothetical protein